MRITMTGNPPTTYINASMITFTNYKQKFIATQAPKVNVSFQNFWEMILENKVKVVVMITALEEKGRRKADQYWPDSETKLLDLGSGITVEHMSTSYQGTYYHRSQHLTLFITFSSPPQSDPGEDT